jgi:hypothetical protein
MTALDQLKEGFAGRISFRERRPNIYQVYAPIFHEDGDMVDLFLDLPTNVNAPVRVSDHGLTLMKLSYNFDLDTPNKKRLFSKIVSENGVTEDDGQLYIESKGDDILPAFLQMAQTVAKVTNLQYLTRQIIQSLFYEILDDFVVSSLRSYEPQAGFIPLTDRQDLEVDWKMQVGSKDLFLYGVKDNSKARLAAISCLEFERRDLLFRSVIVHENFESGLSKKDQSIITNAADKQFTSFDDFKANAEKFFAREAA